MIKKQKLIKMNDVAKSFDDVSILVTDELFIISVPQRAETIKSV